MRLLCFTTANETQCSGERLGIVNSLQQCCLPHSLGGLGGEGYTVGGTGDCLVCPDDGELGNIVAVSS